MKKLTLLKSMLLLCALVAGSGSVWAEDVSTVTASKPTGNTAPSSWSWTGTKSVSWNATVTWKSTAPSATNVTESYYQMGTKNNPATSIVFSTSSIKDRITKIVVDCASYNGLGSISATVGGNAFGTQNQSIEKWANSTGGEVTFIGGATGDIQVTMTNTNDGRAMYIKSITVTYGITDPAAAFEGKQAAIFTVDGGSISSNKWTMTENDDYTLSGTSLSQRSGTDYFKINAGTYTITVPSTIAVNKMAIEGYSTSNDGTPVSVDGNSVTFTKTTATVLYDIATPSAGGNVSFTTSSKEMDIISIVLYTNDGISLTTTDNMDGWRSFYDATQDYEVDANTKIYVAAVSGTAGTVELTQKVDATKIPHGEAVILKTSAGDHKMVLTKTTGAETLGANVLAYKTSGTINGYRLGYKSGPGVAFYKYNAAAPASGVVYIDESNVNTSTGAHEFLAMSFGDDVTAINKIEAKKAENGVFFNLAGQQVAQPTKGLYIVNGKKVVLK